MFRLLCSLLFWSAVGQWMCAEVNLVAPGAAPYLESALKYAQLPTHDTWDIEGFQKLVSDSIQDVSVVLRGRDSADSG